MMKGKAKEISGKEKQRLTPRRIVESTVAIGKKVYFTDR